MFWISFRKIIVDILTNISALSNHLGFLIVQLQMGLLSAYIIKRLYFGRYVMFHLFTFWVLLMIVNDNVNVPVLLFSVCRYKFFQWWTLDQL